MEFKLKCGGVDILLPPPSGEMSISFPGSNKTHDLLAIGEVTSFGIPKQWHLDYKSVLVEESWRHYSASQFTTMITKIMENRQPIWFISSGTAFGDIRVEVSIDSFSATQIAALTNVFEYTIQIKTAKSFGSEYLQDAELPPLPTIPYNPFEPGNPNFDSTTLEDLLSSEYVPPEVKTSHMSKLGELGIVNDQDYYVVEDGEMLIEVVKRFYGSSLFFTPVMEHNPKISNPDFLYKGQLVVLPAINVLRGGAS